MLHLNNDDATSAEQALLSDPGNPFHVYWLRRQKALVQARNGRTALWLALRIKGAPKDVAKLVVYALYYRHINHWKRWEECTRVNKQKASSSSL